jgi:hypothetical protein
MLRPTAVLTTLALTGACTTNPAERPASQPSVAATAAYNPAVSLNEIMVYVVDTHANEIWDAAMKPPATEEEWKALNRAAVVLAASGGLTQVSGNAPNDQQWTAQKDWANHSQSLAAAGIAAVQAVRDRNHDELSKAGDQLVRTCIGCHREYRLDVPKIWTERQFPPEEQHPAR